MSRLVKVQTVLLVEDNEEDAFLVTNILRQSGGTSLSAGDNHLFPLELVHARDGEDAFEYLFRQGDGELRRADNPDLILLDLRMPRIDGFEFLRRIKSYHQLREIPVVVFTSSSHEQDVAECYKLGADDYIIKPFDYLELKQKLLETLRIWLSIPAQIMSELPPENITGKSSSLD